MNLVETEIAGVWLIELDRHEDDRGYFARTYCAREFSDHGLCTTWVQSSVSFNRKKGTLRGLHYQLPPFAETKLIRCVRGAVFDVVLDIRTDSPCYGQWISLELSQRKSSMLYLPPGIAHGFQTIEDDTELSYAMSEIYSQPSARVIAWNSQELNITWPITPPILSNRDATAPEFRR